ncbi:cancer-related nucleoside-triphosphatase homolog [Cylas formicarius]|uniref:cancer-related nucleoside-triphosphatase homolog n=1 Tax=Cylas formicarius TaxID=197179 RepID=UPI0029587703|nr:cancer-related nucleoside-triphosphatase homolog [Cylas formicarius]
MKNILITGVPGIGKTTVIKHIVEKLITVEGANIHGFFTEEIRNDQKQRMGFDIVMIKENRRIQLADKRGVLPQEGTKYLGQYIVYVKNFEQMVLPLLHSVSNAILVIDEIGKMELFSSQFEQAVKSLVHRKDIFVIATVPVKGPPIISHLKEDQNCQVFWVNEKTRDTLPDKLINIVKQINNPNKLPK